MKYSNVIIATGFIIALPCYAASLNINEGEWEFETKMDMPGMPKNMPAQKSKTCMNKNDPVPRGVDKKLDDQSCKTTHQFISSDIVNWTVRCTHGNQVMESKGKGTYRGNTMEGMQTTHMGGQIMTMKITGHRVGVCKN